MPICALRCWYSVLWTAVLQKAIVDLFFPARCLGCSRWGDFICPECFRQIPRIEPPLCMKCGKPESSGLLCPSCWGWHSEIEGIRSVFRFEGLIRHCIHQLKYYNLKALSLRLGDCLAGYLQSNLIPCDVLVPVPLHSKRLKQRGYNQSGLIAAALGKITNLPVGANCLCRTRDSAPQAKSANVEERRQNVAGAFICRNDTLRDGRILLIDDVCTSGATLEACAGALKSAGARSVWGLTIAREI